MYEYALYGISLRSEWPLPYRDSADAGLPVVELLERPGSYFAAASSEADRDAVRPWDQYLLLPDGSEYLRWAGLFEFLISPDGRRIAGRPLPEAALEAFHTYLLGQVLSHALIKLGIEPLHATVVDVDGQAVAFLGDTGRGKSTLAAAFLGAGCRLLTDDLLVLRQNGPGFIAYPGAPRLKLFPDVADTLLGPHAGARLMNPLTSKVLIPLDAAAQVSCPLPLGRLYVLGAPDATGRRRGVTIRRLSERRAFFALVRNTYNGDVTGTDRLTRQFAANAALAKRVPVKLLSSPRKLSELPAVRAAVYADLKRRGGTRGRRRAAVGRPSAHLVREGSQR